RVPTSEATANLFDVLRVSPLLGRAFRRGEDRPGAAPVAILSYALWQSRFQGDPRIVGRLIVADGVSRVIVGIMPRTFGYPSPAVRLWLPLELDPAHAQAGSFNYLAIGPLADGATPDVARA